MDDDSGVITHPKFRMWLRPDGIVQLVLASGTAMVLEDALAATVAVAALTGGRRGPLLVDVHDAGQADRAARLELSSRDDLVSAVGVIVGTPLSRMMGNLIMNVSRPQMPLRLFDDEASAVGWLLTFLG
ncbi:MAG: DUF7793 family protein [Candidatus Limnocylindrales bacterium]